MRKRKGQNVATVNFQSDERINKSGIVDYSTIPDLWSVRNGYVNYFCSNTSIRFSKSFISTCCS